MADLTFCSNIGPIKQGWITIRIYRRMVWRSGQLTWIRIKILTRYRRWHHKRTRSWWILVSTWPGPPNFQRGMGPLWSPGAETPFLEFAKAGGWKTKLQIGGLSPDATEIVVNVVWLPHYDAPNRSVPSSYKNPSFRMCHQWFVLQLVPLDFWF